MKTLILINFSLITKLYLNAMSWTTVYLLPFIKNKILKKYLFIFGVISDTLSGGFDGLYRTTKKWIAPSLWNTVRVAWCAKIKNLKCQIQKIEKTIKIQRPFIKLYNAQFPLCIYIAKYDWLCTHIQNYRNFAILTLLKKYIKKHIKKY